MIYTAGNRADTFAKSWVVRGWIEKQNDRREDGEEMIGHIDMADSRHAMTEEPTSINPRVEFNGSVVRTMSAEFIRGILSRPTVCRVP